MINEAKKPGVKNRQGLYSHVSKFTVEAIDALVNLMRNSRNEGIQLGAARAILDKSLPDIKAIELDTQQNEPIIYTIIGGADVEAYMKKQNEMKR